jgi:hypothetical protein
MCEASKMKSAMTDLRSTLDKLGVDGVIGIGDNFLAVYLQKRGFRDKLIPKEVNGVPVSVVFSGRLRLCQTILI